MFWISASCGNAGLIALLELALSRSSSRPADAFEWISARPHNEDYDKFTVSLA
jgi:hypothetical protein